MDYDAIIIGARVANTIKYHFGDATYYRGPYIDSTYYSNEQHTEVVVRIKHRGGTDFTPASGITGFTITNDSVAVQITAANRIAPDKIQLTLASAIPGPDAGELRYMYGKEPKVTGAVKDNSPLALPLENTTSAIKIGQVSGSRRGGWVRCRPLSTALITVAAVSRSLLGKAYSRAGWFPVTEDASLKRVQASSRSIAAQSVASSPISSAVNCSRVLQQAPSFSHSQV